ncbi:hypothetical protein OOZ15_13665 [Galbibacter sp. EGI 63066]|uniref:hypothetical protein n=1 Tax=Galbibacter sp. EGI 63066 TaxID=2993559 RepID=UPI00224945C0|nr:hypothetical protein [Galbibacter sp. EGI 63066]MCX2680996.1 hypothetical protein [Galbibacter sp. EGI 63066]
MGSLEEELKAWNRQEQKFEGLFPSEDFKGKAFLGLKLRHLDEIRYRFRATPRDTGEAAVNDMLRLHLGEIERKLYPKRFPRILARLWRRARLWSRHNLQDRVVTHRAGQPGQKGPLQVREANNLYRHKTMKKQKVEEPQGQKLSPPSEINSLTKNKTIMEKENLEFLQKKLKYTGFDTALNDELEKNMKSAAEEFRLQHTAKVEGNDMNFSLYFKKSATSDRYFFNKYDAVLRPGNGNEKGQTFYANQSVSAREAYNLLQGRAVHKKLYNWEGKQYRAWLQLDFSAEKDKHNNHKVNQYHQNYGYDLTSVLKGLQVKELGDNRQVEWVEKALKKGNRYQATMEMGGEQQKVFLEANPRYKTVNVLDENGKAISREQYLGEKQKQGPEGTKKTESQSQAGKKKQARKAAKRAPATRKTSSKKKGAKI